MAKLISRIKDSKPTLAEQLQAQGIFSPEILEKHIAQARTMGLSLSEYLIKNNLLNQKELFQKIAKANNLSFEVSPQILAGSEIPERLQRICLRESVCIKSIKDKSLELYIYEPEKIQKLRSLFGALGFSCEFIITLPDFFKDDNKEDQSFKKNQELFSGINDLASTLKNAFSDSTEAIETQDISIDTEGTSIAELVNKTLLLAVNQGASDIHAETTHAGARIRFRIDGVLIDRFELDTGSAANFISRLLIMSNLDITEKVMPQDGSFNVKYQQKDIEFRIASMPGIYGQNLVLRLLTGAEQENLRLESLGMSANEMEIINSQIKFPHGMILVAGPTGSGKSTTLYALLESMADPKLKFITIEDPVERRIDGVQQIQVRINRNEPDRSLTFARGLRTILRLDPDIIMVGEIRDADTAQICVQASLTGHLVLSTVHSNSSVETLRRLENIGIDFSLLMSSLNLIFSQRLVRKLCSDCKQKITPSETEKKLLEKYSAEFIYKAHGCSKCFESGYKGRVGIFEFLPFTEHMKDLIASQGLVKCLPEIRNSRLRTLLDSGFEKISNAKTDFDELERICGPCRF